MRWPECVDREVVTEICKEKSRGTLSEQPFETT